MGRRLYCPDNVMSCQNKDSFLVDQKAACPIISQEEVCMLRHVIALVCFLHELRTCEQHYKEIQTTNACSNLLDFYRTVRSETFCDTQRHILGYSSGF